MPHLYDHISKVGVPWPVIATKWFICMFADVLPVEVSEINKAWYIETKFDGGNCNNAGFGI